MTVAASKTPGSPSAVRRLTPGLQALLALRADPHAPEAAVRAGVSVFLAVAGTAVVGRLDLSAYAVFGAFATLYGRGLQVGDRLRMQVEAGAVLVTSTLLGSLVAFSAERVWLEVPLTGCWAGVVLLASRRRAWNPPGALFPVFALAAIAAQSPARSSQWWQGLLTATAALTVAITVNLAFYAIACASFVRRRPAAGEPAPSDAPRPAPVSLHRRDAIQAAVLAAVTATAGFGANVAGIGHPYWAMITSVAALAASDTARKTLRSVHRGLGSVAGALLAVLLYQLLTTLHPSELAVIGVVALLQVGAELFVTRNYGAAVVFVTPLAVVMTWLPDGVDRSAIHDRIVTTGVGLAPVTLVLLAVTLRHTWSARSTDDAVGSAPSKAPIPGKRIHMSTPVLPAAVRTFVEATNRGDSDAFAAAFTEDAYLNDWGREFHGRDGVRAWDRTDNIGVQAHFEPRSVEPGPDADSYVVTLTVTGNGYNGTGPMTFHLRDGLIASLRISG